MKDWEHDIKVAINLIQWKNKPGITMTSQFHELHWSPSNYLKIKGTFKIQDKNDPFLLPTFRQQTDVQQGSVGTFCTCGRICRNMTSIDASCNAFSQETHFAYRLAKITKRGSVLVKWPVLTCWCGYLLAGQTGSVQKVRWGIGFCRCSRCEIFSSYLPQVSWSPANPDYCSPDPSIIIHIGLTSVWDMFAIGVHKD